MMNESWAEHAACCAPSTDPDLFFPLGELDVEAAPAKAVCARCSVAAQCLGWALRTGEQNGIWGGTTPVERRLLRRADRPSRHTRRAA
jgi:WhiB family redox-sensing transcriptional regulator